MRFFSFKIIVGLICILLFSSFKKKKEEFSEYVKIEEHLFASSTEVSNKQYKEFLHYLFSSGDIEKYNVCLPDSDKWHYLQKHYYGEPEKVYYHNHRAYDYYPAVSITKEAMELYCDWMTTQYHQQAGKVFKKVVFRLPTELEWIKIASATAKNILKSESRFAMNPDRNMLANISLHKEYCGKYYNRHDPHTYNTCHNNYDIPGSVICDRKNKYGIYNIIGNVCEVTAEGTLFGGSWLDKIEDCEIGKKQFYTLPDPRVGFRIVMEVLEP